MIQQPGLKSSPRCSPGLLHQSRRGFQLKGALGEEDRLAVDEQDDP